MLSPCYSFRRVADGITEGVGRCIVDSLEYADHLAGQVTNPKQGEGHGWKEAYPYKCVSHDNKYK